MEWAWLPLARVWNCRRSPIVSPTRHRPRRPFGRPPPPRPPCCLPPTPRLTARAAMQVPRAPRQPLRCRRRQRLGHTARPARNAGDRAGGRQHRRDTRVARGYCAEAHAICFAARDHGRNPSESGQPRPHRRDDQLHRRPGQGHDHRGAAGHPRCAGAGAAASQGNAGPAGHHAGQGQVRDRREPMSQWSDTIPGAHSPTVAMTHPAPGPPHRRPHWVPRARRA